MSNSYPQQNVNYQKVMGSVSGWGGGITTDSNTPTPIPALPVSPEDLMNKLREIENKVDKRRIDQLFKLISDHVHNKDNPHGLTLEQLTDDVIGMLHGVYLSLGYVGGLEYFREGLFKVFEIATAREIDDGTDPDMLITIAGMRSFISEHNRDLNAHAEMFEKLVPGTPVLTEPDICWNADLLFPAGIQSLQGSRYTYIGQDGHLYVSETATLPTDYTYGVGMVPVWGPRTNLVVNSTDFTTYAWTKENIEVLHGYQGLDKTNTGTRLSTTTDTVSTKHRIGFDNIVLQLDTTYTFSVYFKPINCKYVEFEIIGKPVGSRIRTRFDLSTSTPLIMNTDGTSGAEIVKLASGWYRMGVTWDTEYSMEHSIMVTPYTTSPTGDGGFIGTGEELGCIWGAQLEDGIGMSPFIYTFGEHGSRTPIDLTYLVDDRYSQDYGTWVFEHIAPIYWDGVNNTLYHQRNSFRTDMEGVYRDNRLYLTMNDTFGNKGFEYMVPDGHSRKRTISQTYSENEQLVGVSGMTTAKLITRITKGKDVFAMDIGHKNGTDYLNSYIRMVMYFKDQMDEKNHTFLVGV